MLPTNGPQQQLTPLWKPFRIFKRRNQWPTGNRPHEAIWLDRMGWIFVFGSGRAIIKGRVRNWLDGRRGHDNGTIQRPSCPQVIHNAFDQHTSRGDGWFGGDLGMAQGCCDGDRAGIGSRGQGRRLGWFGGGGCRGWRNTRRLGLTTQKLNQTFNGWAVGNS